MKITESYIERTRYKDGKSYKVNERCDLLSELNQEDLYAIYRERLSVEFDEDNKIDLGLHQSGWTDENWHAIGFTVSIDYAGINSFSLKRENVTDGTSIEKVRKDVIREKIEGAKAKRGTSGYAALRWSGGDHVEDIIMRTGYKGLAIVRETTMLAD